MALVTGSSSRIGFETSLALARNGFYTFATMRNISKGEKIKELAKKENLPIEIIELDVDKENSVKNTINTIIEKKQRIDILVNNAGWGLWGSVEDVSIDEFKAQFETNFFSIIRMIQEVAPIMREQKSGHIINISSIAGRIGFPISPAYISSKFALEGLSESLRFELMPFGVNVIIIESGIIKTNFFEPMKLGEKAEKTDVYKNITEKVLSGVKMMAQMDTDPKEVSNTIIQAIKFSQTLK